MTNKSSTSHITTALLIISFATTISGTSAPSPATFAGDQQPLFPGTLASVPVAYPNTVPALPVTPTANQNTTNTSNVTNGCRLDLSDELFGGVGDACGNGLDRSRCCPVLAAWLFAAHARAALQLKTSPAAPAIAGDGPMMPDDNQRCVESLQSALERRGVSLARPNASCDAVLCFCGIRLHQIGSLRCPAAFNVSGGSSGEGDSRNVTPTAAVRQLERECRKPSYVGCSRCLHSLDKLKGRAVAGIGSKSSSSSSIARSNMMFGRDCELMGLTWLLAKNKTAYIPTVSAVLRAILYSDESSAKCSTDQENMPLAVDSLQFQHLGQTSAASELYLCCYSFALRFWYIVMLSFLCLVVGDFRGGLA